MKVDKKKIGALVTQHAQKKMPPKKGAHNPPSKHAEEEASHEPGETAEHEQEEHDGGGEDDAGKDKEIAEQQAARVQNGNGDDELEGIVGDDEHDEGGEPPHWATDHDVWERAEKAVEELADVDEEHKMLVLAHVYEALGGEVAGKSGSNDDDDEENDDPEDDEDDDASEAKDRYDEHADPDL